MKRQLVAGDSTQTSRAIAQLELPLLATKSAVIVNFPLARVVEGSPPRQSPDSLQKILDYAKGLSK